MKKLLIQCERLGAENEKKFYNSKRWKHDALKLLRDLEQKFTGKMNENIGIHNWNILVDSFFHLRGEHYQYQTFKKNQKSL